MSKQRRIPSRPAPQAPALMALQIAAEKARLAGQWQEFERLVRQILRQAPGQAWATSAYSAYLIGQGRQIEAIPLIEAGLKAHPRDAQLWVNLAACQFYLGRYPECAESARQAIELNPKFGAAWINLSSAYHCLEKFKEAEQAARQAVALPGEYAVHAWNCLANALKGQGRMQEAIEASRKVLEIDPDFESGKTNLLFNLLYYEHATTEEIARTAFELSAHTEAPHKAHWPRHDNPPEPWRRLRVGFISPDLRLHSVMYFAEIPIARLDRQQFEIYCYAVGRERDEETERVRRFADHWRDLGTIPAEAQARIILEDKIDVLIDLAGYTGSNALPTLARKPAPIQISWLGYPGTTGMTAVDWLITDDVLVPEDEDHLYSERLIRLPPPAFAYRPLIRQPILRHWPTYQVNQCPALSKGYITFGCCNNIAKLTPRTLKTWAELLRRLPTAHLLIEGNGLKTEEEQASFRQHLLQHGIPDERLTLIPREGKNQYLTYHQIDIALDPFPLTGGTTSFDLLWMGLPLVTLESPGTRGKLSATLLHGLNRREWIAHNEEEYLAIAEGLAADVHRLNADRLAQRLRMEHSPLMDEAAFASLFGAAIRQTWLHWCAQKIVGDDDLAQARQIQDWIAQREPPPPYQPLVHMAAGQHIPLAEAWHMLNQALGSENWPEVKRIGLLIIESISKEPVALMALAELEHAHGNYQAAKIFAEHAIEEAPEMDEWYQRLADWHLAAGNEKAALHVLQVLAARLSQRVNQELAGGEPLR